MRPSSALLPALDPASHAAGPRSLQCARSQATSRIPGAGLLPPRATAAQRQRGFSLAGALVTIAVLGVLSQIAWPALQDAIDRRRLETLAADFAHDLQLARSLAVSGEQALRLSVTLDAAGSCYVLHLAPHDHCRCSAAGARCSGDAPLFRHRWIAGATRMRIAANVSGVTLHPGEGFVTSAGTFRIEQPSTGRGIWYVLSPVGRVRSCAKDWEPSALPRCTGLPS
ncbi:MAG TPA: GspH/FimT family pseudopilin [Burkholderiaceae bacterium]|nr:GspH/FimT family pseudopilin [Burkholderiaceae bacterium]